MLVTFGATFAGVFASFFLWFGGEWLLKRHRDNATGRHTLGEIEEEMRLNIVALEELIVSIPTEIDKGSVPTFIPNRLPVQSRKYALESGDIRLLTEDKQRVIRLSIVESETFNRFIENTELLLAVCLIKPDGLATVKYRLNGLLQSAKGTREFLVSQLKYLRGDR
jgi:hypothetical protein